LSVALSSFFGFVVLSFDVMKERSAAPA